MGTVAEAAVLNLRRLADKADRYGWNVERDELRNAAAELDALRQQLAEAEHELSEQQARAAHHIQIAVQRGERLEAVEAKLAEHEAKLVHVNTLLVLEFKRAEAAEAERDRLKDALQAFCSPSAWKEIKTRVDVALLAPTQTEQTP